MERNVSSPSLSWGRNMTAVPQWAVRMEPAGVPLQRAMTRTRNMASVPAEVCVTGKGINNCLRVRQSRLVLANFCDPEQIRLLSVGIPKESPATSPSCSSAKSMIPAPVRVDKMASCGAVPLLTMIKTKNGACVLTKVTEALEDLRCHKICIPHCYLIIFLPVGVL